jgi:hypothetical protein
VVFRKKQPNTASRKYAGIMHLNPGKLRRGRWWDYLVHKRLDEAVFAAYGWKSDLSDEEILEKLLALNLERAKNQK